MTNSMGMKAKGDNLSPATSDKENHSPGIIQRGEVSPTSQPTSVRSSTSTHPSTTSISYSTSASGTLPSSTSASGTLPSSASAPSNLYSASGLVQGQSNNNDSDENNVNTVHTPGQSPRPLTSGPRPHPSHADRPSSAPPHHLEKLSGTILRAAGDIYNSKSYAESLRMVGDQMTFEADVRRALSFSDLHRYQSQSNPKQ